ncbi:MAG: GIY-YIG nuclease family protein [Proteobacteria bacterium]|nr:GIY-YIG nuclease family protein [Pseudomonadota bacterium]
MVGREPFIACYIMSNRRHGTLYIGVTSNLLQRAIQHREGAMAGFTRRYRLHRLVWYEEHDVIVAAIAREKALKFYPRDWKLNLIDAMNPTWDDLFPGLWGGGAALDPGQVFPPLPNRHPGPCAQDP